ncbi:MAG: hypothetical protein ACXW2Q_03045 [Thermoanaerobaculia bacterium]
MWVQAALQVVRKVTANALAIFPGAAIMLAVMGLNFRCVARSLDHRTPLRSRRRRVRRRCDRLLLANVNKQIEALLKRRR